MQKLTIKSGVIRWEKQNTINTDEVDFIRNFRISETEGIKDIEKIDENTIQVSLQRTLDETGGVYLFVCEDTEVNGKLYSNSDELIEAITK